MTSTYVYSGLITSVCDQITSGDDCCDIKSGRDVDAWQLGQPTKNVIVRGNTCNGPGNGTYVANLSFSLVCPQASVDK